jgi:hypothetical protein
LVEALVKEGVFVHSRITDYKIDGFELVVEHAASRPRQNTSAKWRAACRTAFIIELRPADRLARPMR